MKNGTISLLQILIRYFTAAEEQFPAWFTNMRDEYLTFHQWGSEGASTEAAYSASKGAVNSLTKSLAKELAPSNIQVNALAPGLIATSMNAHLSLEEMEALYEEIPAGRAGLPEEIAETAYQILTGPSYLTGQIINIDGAWI